MERYGNLGELHVSAIQLILRQASKMRNIYRTSEEPLSLLLLEGVTLELWMSPKELSTRLSEQSHLGSPISPVQP